MPIRTCPGCDQTVDIPSNKVTCCLKIGESLSRGARKRKLAEIAQGGAVKSTDALAMLLRDRLRKKTFSHSELADHFDVSPKKIRAAVEWLNTNGYNVAVSDAGAEARLLIDRNATQNRQLTINAEKFYGDTLKFEFGVISDTHLCSKFYRAEIAEAAYDNFAAHGIRHVFHGGNYIEGERHDKFHLLSHGMQGQIDYFVKNYPQRKGIITYYVAGDDHEGWYQQDSGIDIGRFTQMEAEKQGRKDLVNLGYMEADVTVAAPDGKCIIRVVHAGGGSSYAISYTVQKMIESYEGGEKPNVLLVGHYHKAEYIFYRNVHSIQMGTTKAQDTFMRKKRLAAHLGAWRVSMTLGRDGTIREFTPTLLPFYNRGFYEAMAIDVESDEVSFKGPNEEYGVVR